MASPALIGPKILCFGAQKAGTTWLHGVLAKHPQFVQMPLKELHFYNYHDYKPSLLPLRRLFGRNGVNQWWRQVARKALRTNTLLGSSPVAQRNRHYLFAKRDETWFPKLFSTCPEDTYFGDFTPDYAFQPPEVIEQIATASPRARLLYILREPVSRAWSQCMMDLAWMKGVDREHLSDDVILDYARSKSVQRNNSYTANYQNWAKVFGEERLKVMFYDDLVADNATFLKEVCAHLDMPWHDGWTSEVLNERVFAGRGHKPSEELRSRLRDMFAPEVEACRKHFDNVPANW